MSTTHPRIVGYIRVSSKQQTYEQQRDALAQLGATEFFQDKISGAKWTRAGLEECLASLAEGDVLCVWKIDRFGRDVAECMTTVKKLRDRGVILRSTSDGIDSSTPAGRMVMGVLASIAEYERELLLERMALKQEYLQKLGRNVGRKPKITRDQAVMGREMQVAGRTANDVAQAFNTTKVSLYRAYERYGISV
ncbi:MAG: recombinase family protein [Nocardiaceae bacterium]|nr:recombinase family protein [Nocardiaceae bacterium]